MMRILFAVLLFAVASAIAAQPVVTSIEPNAGFTFRETIVTIHGSGFSQSDFDCQPQVNRPFCPARVFFGPSGMEGTVLAATPTTLTVRVPQRPHGEQGPVLVRLRDRSEAVLASGFRWDASKLPDSPADYDRYLVPVTTGEVRGANGSIWQTEWIVHNISPYLFSMIWPACPPTVSPCPGRQLAPESSTRPSIVPRGDGSDGAFVHVPKPMRPAMALRVRDLSQNAQSFGTDIPVVGPQDWRSHMELLDIPTDPRYRATLRVYNSAPEPHAVTVSVFSAETGRHIETYGVELNGVESDVPEPFPLHPAYAQLDPLTPAVRASGGRVRIRIISTMHLSGISPPPGWPAWAFVSVTNNETQQVTAVVPRP